jgi:subtilisin family serine protease
MYQATVIPVKFTNDEADWLSALESIADDLQAHPGRERHSVVLTAAGLGGLTRDDVRNDQDTQKYLGRPISAILALGVPFVCAAGNSGEDGKPINSVPALLQETDTPIIVVRSNDYDGSRSSFSQLGPQLTIYAPGREVECQGRGSFETVIKSGTSYGK